MKIKLILDIPEAETKKELRELARRILKAGSDYSLVDFRVVDFEL